MSGVIVLVVLSLLLGGLLGWAASRYRVEQDPVIERINLLLPQTQCAQCGFPGCRPYAEALARGDADINQCPPGGEAGVRALAELLGREPVPLDAARGQGKPKAVAVVVEQDCIGCTKCILACPVDAIVGAAKRMHSVVPELCTGCELCVAPCPVDCIVMEPPAASDPRRIRRPDVVRENAGVAGSAHAAVARAVAPSLPE